MLQTLKNFILLVFLGLLASCSSVFDTLNTPSQDNSKAVIAVLLPISGSNQELATSLLHTIELANKHHLNKNIIIKVYDTKGSLTEAKKQMKQAIADNAQIVIGPMFAKTTASIAPMAENKGIPVFTLSNDIRLLQNYDNVFMLTNSPFYDIEAEVAYVKKQGSKRVAVLAPQNTYGDLSVAFLKASLANNNLELVRVVRYSSTRANLTYELNRLIPYGERIKYQKTQKALSNHEVIQDEQGNIITEPPKPKLNFDTLIIADEGRRLAVVASHFPLIDLAYQDLTIIGNSLWESNLVISNEILQNAYYVTDITSPVDTSFYKEYVAYYKTPPSKLSYTIYDAFMLASASVYQDPDGNTVIDLAKNQFGNTKTINGVLSPFYMNQNNIKVKDMAVKQISHFSIKPVTTLPTKDITTISSYIEVLSTLEEEQQK